jgi:hypothetical protein
VILQSRYPDTIAWEPNGEGDWSERAAAALWAPPIPLSAMIASLDALARALRTRRPIIRPKG